jgi:hypothetical protein
MMLKSMNLPANESLAVPTNINYDAKFCYANINYDAKFCYANINYDAKFCYANINYDAKLFYANILIKIFTKSLTT